MQLDMDTVYEGTVTGLTNFGAFVKLDNGTTGMVHISEVSSTYIKDIHEKLSEGDTVTVKVIEINEKGKIALSIKQALPQDEAPPKRPSGDRPRRSQPQVWTGTPKTETEGGSFEDMLARFKTVSDEKLSDLKKNNVAKRGSSTPRRGGGNPRG